MYIHRDLEKAILKAGKAFPVLLVTGPRQVGKTTLLEQMAAKDRKYVTLDNPMARALAISDPELFLTRYAPPVLIDEIQYAPSLLPYIKMHVDTHRQAGDIWLTGSQMFHLMKHVSESLAGRVGIVQLLGLSGSELAGRSGEPFMTETSFLLTRLEKAKKQTLSEVYERIYTGAFPALYATKQDIELFYSSYLNTYIQRDIKDLTQVGDELAFLRFLTCCAARTAQTVNYADMAKDVGISPPTAKQWLAVLVSSGIVTLIEPYFNNALTRIIKSPKMYFLDTGLCAYLTKWNSAATLEAGAMSGAFFETYAVGEIIKSYYHAGKRPPLYFYRDTDGKEIDCIIEQNNTLYPIEVKKSANIGKDAVKHFPVLQKTGKTVGMGSVVCMCADLLPIDKQTNAVPVWVI